MGWPIKKGATLAQAGLFSFAIFQRYLTAKSCLLEALLASSKISPSGLIDNLSVHYNLLFAALKSNSLMNSGRSYSRIPVGLSSQGKLRKEKNNRGKNIYIALAAIAGLEIISDSLAPSFTGHSVFLASLANTSAVLVFYPVM